MNKIKKYILGKLKILRCKIHLFLIKWKAIYSAFYFWLTLIIKLMFFKINLDTYHEGLELLKAHMDIIFPSCDED